MRTITKQARFHSDHQDWDWSPIAFVPLCKQSPSELLDTYMAREADKKSLADFARIDDDELLGDLVDAGFTPATLPALQLAPIAFVAWASQYVTEEECQSAVATIYESRLHEFPAAMSRMQSWLDMRPDQNLWDLWFAFTRCRLERTEVKMRITMGNQLLRQATAVVLASGGFLGIGRICPGEQWILDGIQSAFDLP